MNRSLRTKIFMAIISVVVIILICLFAMFFYNMDSIADMLLESNEEMSRTSSDMSSSSMDDLSQTRLQELADNKADIANNVFYEYEQAVSVIAAAAEKIYSNPDQYTVRTPPLPEFKNDGKLAVQTLYAEGTDPNDEELVKELGMLGNMQDLLYVMNNNIESMASIYVATESGAIIMADYISAQKFDSEGNIKPFDARERPWYHGAVVMEGPYFTSIVQDAHTPRRGIMCGVPIYREGVLMGVAGAGIYLDGIEKLVQGMDLGENGDVCIINQYGQVLFSTFKEGALAVSDEGEDVRKVVGGELSEAVDSAILHEHGIRLVDIDGVMEYVAYAPMETVGWSVVIVLSKEEVEKPTVELQEGLNRISDQAIRNARTFISRYNFLAIAMCFVAIAAAFILSYALSRRIVEPIQKLTTEVKRTDGENLDFTWDMDTGDEIEILADSFRSLAMRMREYIGDIQVITSERERIETELSLSARIQNSMLPHIFPPYPNRNEFDVYASMKPARKVGGDFYDFFMIDDDHLCLEIADVSGKGVPAALFMMISKTILQNSAKMGLSVSDILARTNDTICSNNQEGMFVTVWIGILEISTGKLTAANAGHEYPVLMQPGGHFELYKDKHGIVLGAMEDMMYKEYEIQLEPGSKLFVYTDGLVEATDKNNNMFGTKRLLEALNRELNSSPKEVLDGVQRAVDIFEKKAEQFDDLTMLCIEYKG